jgi:hypothetical protein
MGVLNIEVSSDLIAELRKQNCRSGATQLSTLCYGEICTKSGVWGPADFAIGVISRHHPRTVNGIPQTPVHFVTFDDVECGLVGFEDIEGDEVRLDWIDGKVVRIG